MFSGAREGVATSSRAYGVINEKQPHLSIATAEYTCLQRGIVVVIALWLGENSLTSGECDGHIKNEGSDRLLNDIKCRASYAPLLHTTTPRRVVRLPPGCYRYGTTLTRQNSRSSFLLQSSPDPSSNRAHSFTSSTLTYRPAEYMVRRTKATNRA